MGCIYRYIDLKDNIIKYVGIVWSDNRTLKKRITEHLSDAWFKNKEWKIEYIEEDIRTRTDAEYFESHYISLYGTDKWYNYTKVNWGISHYLPNRENDWKLYDVLKCESKNKSKYVKNDLLKYKGDIIRVLDVREENVLVINCTHKSMPKLISVLDINSCSASSEDELLKITNMAYDNIESLDDKRKEIMKKRYSLVSGVLPFLADEKIRSFMISKIAEQNNISTQSIRSYLCSYLIYQDVLVLAPKKNKKEELTPNEKNMKWALDNYYNKITNSKTFVYDIMLKEKYMDASGELLSNHPSINQFKYFCRKYYN